MSVIKVKDVRKKFKVYYDKGQTFKEKLLFRNRNYYEDRWVLNGISFEVQRGQALALIGENGCGKSTLLKLMTKIMYPDSGSIIMQGRVSSLIELGAGFHPDMSGRENIYTNASIFGLTKKEIDERLRDIIDFSELEQFIDNPVRTYSSGMYMRLAFSVAINVDADILLIDEILAVGDTNFQAKCFNRLRELKAKGVTVVLVTHDMGVVERFCDYAVWINAGQMTCIAKAAQVVDEYLCFMNDKRRSDLNIQMQKQNEHNQGMVRKEDFLEQVGNTCDSQPQPQAEVTKSTPLEQQAISSDHFGLGHVRIKKVTIHDVNGVSAPVLVTNESYSIKFFYEIIKPISGYVFGYAIYTLDGILLTASNTQLDRFVLEAKASKGVITLQIEQLALLQGEYFLQVAVVDEDGTPMDFYRRYCSFSVITEEKSVGVVALPHYWFSE